MSRELFRTADENDFTVIIRPFVRVVIPAGTLSLSAIVGRVVHPIPTITRIAIAIHQKAVFFITASMFIVSGISMEDYNRLYNWSGALFRLKSQNRTSGLDAFPDFFKQFESVIHPRLLVDIIHMSLDCLDRYKKTITNGFLLDSLYQQRCYLLLAGSELKAA